jgi:integrase
VLAGIQKRRAQATRLCRITSSMHCTGTRHPLSFVTFHTFCHTWATWMRRYGGLDTKSLVATRRWRSEQSASRYQHVVVSEESERADLLPRKPIWLPSLVTCQMQALAAPRSVRL